MDLLEHRPAPSVACGRPNPGTWLSTHSDGRSRYGLLAIPDAPRSKRLAWFPAVGRDGRDIWSTRPELGRPWQVSAERGWLALGALLLVCWVVGCGGTDAPTEPKQTSKLEQLLAESTPSVTQASTPLYTSNIRLESPANTGLDFIHQAGNSEERPFPAANGSGVGVIDYDLDGYPDLYFANGTTFPIDESNQQYHDPFYRNLGQTRFVEIGREANAAHHGYSAGVAVGDFDGDGFPDIYVTCYGKNVLYRNQGDGTFVEMAEVAGVADKHWGTSALWLDVNDDGALDLYVGNYGIWDLEINKFCREPSTKERIFCSPLSVEPAPDFLYLNQQDGTFADISDSSGIGGRKSRTQGVLAADFNDDGLIDLYLGNDMHANSLFLNEGGGVFKDLTDRSGMGYSSTGGMQAGMGVTTADVDRNLDLEVFVTNYTGENNNLYKQISPGRYSDISDAEGLASDSIPWVGWGTLFLDLDLDGWQDLVVTNGHTDHNKPNQPYAQPACVWQNVAGRFRRISPESGEHLAGEHIGRGLATGDFDHDGRLDLVFANLGQKPALVLNRTPEVRGWVLRLEGTRSNRDGVGAKVFIRSIDGDSVHHRVAGGSYLSTSSGEVWVPFQSGELTAEVVWGPGRTSTVRLDPLPLGKVIVMREKGL